MFGMLSGMLAPPRRLLPLDEETTLLLCAVPQKRARGVGRSRVSACAGTWRRRSCRDCSETLRRGGRWLRRETRAVCFLVLSLDSVATAASRSPSAVFARRLSSLALRCCTARAFLERRTASSACVFDGDGAPGPVNARAALFVCGAKHATGHAFRKTPRRGASVTRASSRSACRARLWRCASLRQARTSRCRRAVRRSRECISSTTALSSSRSWSHALRAPATTKGLDL